MRKFTRYVEAETFSKIKRSECNIHGSTYVYYGNDNFKGTPEKLKELEEAVKAELSEMSDDYPKMAVCKISSNQSKRHAYETMIKVMVPTVMIANHKRRYRAL